MPVDSRVTLALVATGDRAVCATLLLFLLPVIFFRSDFFTRVESTQRVGWFSPVGWARPLSALHERHPSRAVARAHFQVSVAPQCMRRLAPHDKLSHGNRALAEPLPSAWQCTRSELI